MCLKILRPRNITKNLNNNANKLRIKNKEFGGNSLTIVSKYVIDVFTYVLCFA